MKEIHIKITETAKFAAAVKQIRQKEEERHKSASSL